MKKNKKNFISETIKTITYAAIIAIFVRTVAFEPFNIPSKSMMSTLLVGDYLFVSKYSYGYSRYSLPLSLHLFNGRIFEKSPQRGDVSVFKIPSDDSIAYIKRVIGLPNDRIQIIHRVIYINGEPIERKKIDDYIEYDNHNNVQTYNRYIETLPNGKSYSVLEYLGAESQTDNTPEYIIPANHYFMMGDNRNNSQDSRYLNVVGYIPGENMVGRAEFIFFSIKEFWKFWKLPLEIRWNRFFSKIH
ncbi:MAG: signal peptidase I [Rhodospirillaceae bacterium]|jgi:signal peptidase I|nr:signal peptidase I [Rhodospirillaceae bacterium]